MVELILSISEGTEACMRQAYDLGINFFDTAEGCACLAKFHILYTDGLSYAGGKSEIVMGNVIKKAGWKRNDLVISTKVWPRIADEPANLPASVPF